MMCTDTPPRLISNKKTHTWATDVRHAIVTKEVINNNCIVSNKKSRWPSTVPHSVCWSCCVLIDVTKRTVSNNETEVSAITLLTTKEAVTGHDTMRGVDIPRCNAGHFLRHSFADFPSCRMLVSQTAWRFVTNMSHDDGVQTAALSADLAVGVC
jgi:hypothetical protein